MSLKEKIMWVCILMGYFVAGGLFSAVIVYNHLKSSPETPNVNCKPITLYATFESPAVIQKVKSDGHSCHPHKEFAFVILGTNLFCQCGGCGDLIQLKRSGWTDGYASLDDIHPYKLAVEIGELRKLSSRINSATKRLKFNEAVDPAFTINQIYYDSEELSADIEKIK